jgi:DNA-binding MarR family transcriptional regulator
MDALRRIVRALRVGNAAMVGSLGVSSAQLFALRQIARRPGQSLSDIAAATMTTQSSISEVVTRLVQRGLVARKVSDEDHRRIELEATKAGIAAVASAPPSTQEKLLAGFLSLPPKKQQLLSAGLDEWLEAAGLQRVEPTMFFE